MIFNYDSFLVDSIAWIGGVPLMMVRRLSTSSSPYVVSDSCVFLSITIWVFLFKDVFLMPQLLCRGHREAFKRMPKAFMHWPWIKDFLCGRNFSLASGCHIKQVPRCSSCSFTWTKWFHSINVYSFIVLTLNTNPTIPQLGNFALITKLTIQVLVSHTG